MESPEISEVPIIINQANKKYRQDNQITQSTLKINKSFLLKESSIAMVHKKQDVQSIVYTGKHTFLIKFCFVL